MNLLVSELCEQQRCEQPPLDIAAAQTDEGTGRERAVQHSRDSEIPLDPGVEEPQPTIDGGSRGQNDDRPSPGSEVPRKQCPEQREAREVERGVVESEMDEVRRQQAPPLPGRDRRAVVAQQAGGGCAEKLQREHEPADCEQRRAIAPVAVESSKPEPEFQRLRDRGRIRPAKPRSPVSSSGKEGGSGTGERLSEPV